MTRSRLRVLTYHRVLEPSDPAARSPSLISATPAVFEQQVRQLARRQRVLPAEEVLAAVRNGAPLPARAVLVTFDDAYRDFGEIAWPILRRYHVPATVFVPTSYPDTSGRGFWWDRLYRAIAGARALYVETAALGRLALENGEARRRTFRQTAARLKRRPPSEITECVEELCRALDCPDPEPTQVLGWSELRALAADGVTLAPHTRTHAPLTQLGDADVRAELSGARADLEARIGATPSLMAYPFGACDARVAALARAEGVALALTTENGDNDLASADPLRLRRMSIGLRTTPTVFRLRLLGPIARADAWRRNVAGARSGQQRSRGLGPTESPRLPLEAVRPSFPPGVS